MESILEVMIGELQRECETTRRVLDRVPDDKLTWRPHAKSMTIGQLALHVATIPSALSHLAQLDTFDAANANFEPAQPTTKAEILSSLEVGVAGASAYLRSLNPASGDAPWRLTLHGAEVFSMPRTVMLRNLMLNHWYHHRGQLSVYLRLLDVPVPVIYGRSADENPFGSL
jgi:uncharacterized damage-inducible protein DinB